MAMTFPASPTVGQIFTSGNKSWQWDGTTWLAYGASLSPTVLKVDSTNARVGINNQSPTQALDVTGVINSRRSAGFDSLALVGPLSAGADYSAVITATALSGSQTYTLPNATGTVALTSDFALTLVKSQTVGAGATTIDVTSCFTSTYDNYKIVYNGGTCSGNTSISSQFLVGSTPDATNYYGGVAFINVGAGNWQLGVNNGGSSWTCGWARGTDTGFSFDCHNVFQAKPTTCMGMFARLDNGQVGHTTIQHAVGTSYNGIRFIIGGGLTVTGGTISVYGYKR
jgi:hypothetical protein